jgi:selT/selW/selH-like putative selenoprotein
MLKLGGKRKRSETALPKTVPFPPAQGPEAAEGGTRKHIEVTIEYGKLGNYLTPAQRLARSIHEELGAESTLIPSTGGAFEVRVQGNLVFSKRATHRLPADEEIFYHVRAAQSF